MFALSKTLISKKLTHRLLGVLILLLFGINSVQASHVMGADISYKEIDTNTGTYLFTVSLYRDCSGIDYAGEILQLYYSQGFVSIPLNLLYKQEVTPICKPPNVPVAPYTPCPGPNTPVGPNGIKGVQKVVYTCTYTLGKGNGLAFVGWSTCCRNSAITTGAANQGIWVQALINTDIVNNSVVMTTNPVPYWCKYTQQTYNHGAVDSFDNRYVSINGQQVVKDSIAYALIAPFSGPAASVADAANFLNPSVTFNAPLNNVNFLYTTNGVTIDPINGTITCTPDRDQDAVMAVAILEYRAVPNANGIGYHRVLAGYTCRDIQFTVKSNCNPIVAPGVIYDSLQNSNYINSTTVDICGARFSHITYKIVGPYGERLKVGKITPLSTQSVVNFRHWETIVTMANVDTVFGYVEFDSTIGTGYDQFMAEFFYCNTIGIRKNINYILTLRFKQTVYVTKDTGYYCNGGKPYRIYARGADTFAWTPRTGIVGASGRDSSWIDVAPTNTTIYTVKGTSGVNLTQTCSLYDTALVVNIPKFNYSLSPKVSNLCLGDTFRVLLNTQVTDTPYKYNWTNSGGTLFNPLTNLSTTSISSPKGVVVDTRTMYVEMTSKYSCTIQDSIQVNLKGVVSNATAHSNRNLVCPGDTTLLSVSVVPKITGLSVFKAAGTPINYNLLSTSGSFSYPVSCAPAVPSTCYPNIYGTVGAGKSSQTRIIYKKSELTGMGMSAGTIRAISFNVTSLNDPNLDYVIIKMGGTSGTNAVTDILLYTVCTKTGSSAMVSNGWNTYTLDRGFDWDGNSNIMVEVSVYKSTTYLGTNSYSALGSNASNTVAYRYSSTSGIQAKDMTGGWVTGGLTFSKPEIRWNWTRVDSSDVQYLTATWAPSYMISAKTNPLAIVTANQKDSVMTATIGTSQCFDTAVVIVGVDTSFKVSASGSTYICKQTGVSNPVNLTSVIRGTPDSITWTSIPSSAGSGLPSNIHTANITVNPTLGVWKYVVTTYALPCKASDTVTVSVDDSLKFTMTIDTPVCLASNGKLHAKLPSGTLVSDYSYTWQGVSPVPATTSDTASNLGGGSYSLKLTLLSNTTCKGTAYATLVPKVYPLSLAMATTGVKCYGGTADSITVNVSSTKSVGPYKYNWNTTSANAGDTMNNILSKPIGTYTVTATDRITGCVGNSNLTVSQPAQLAISFTKDDVKCKGLLTGHILATVTGGDQTNGTYIYQWSRGNGTSVSTFNELFGLSADTFTLTVTDGNGCMATKGIRITEPSLALSTTISKINATVVNGCDGVAFANTTGGTGLYTYTWNATTNSANNVLHNNISSVDSFKNRCKSLVYLTVTDGNGCQVNDSVYVKDIECNIVASIQYFDVDCYGAKTGKIKFGAQDLKNLATTNKYYYTLYRSTNHSNMVKKDSSVLPYPPAAYTTFDSLVSAVYNIRVQTDRGCDTDFTPLVINQNSAMIISTSYTEPTCIGYSDGEVMATVNDLYAPFQFKWDASGYVTDTFYYSSAVTDATAWVQNSNGCQQSFQYSIIDTSYITPKWTEDTVVRCYGESNSSGTISISTNLQNPVTYYYINKPGVLTDTTVNRARGLSAGTYSVTIKYANAQKVNHCSVPLSFTISEPTKLVLTARADSTRCSYVDSGKITTSYTGGNAGSHIYTLTNSAGVIRSNVGSTIADLSPGTYQIKIEDRKGCADSVMNLVVSEPDSFMITLSSVNTPCIEVNKGTAKIDNFIGGNTTANYSVIWSRYDKPTSTTISNVGTGSSLTSLQGLSTYTAIAYDSKGCVATKSIDVDTDYVFKITAVETDSAKCYGSSDGKITITGIEPSTNPSYNYTWSNGQTSSNNYMRGAQGTYSVVATDGNGCTATSIATIDQPTEIVIVGKVLDALCHGSADGSIKVSISGGTPLYGTPQWSSNPTQVTDSAVSLVSGTYTVTVFDKNNCPQTANFTVGQPDTFYITVDTVHQITCYAANNGSIKISTTGGYPSIGYVWSNTSDTSNSLVNLAPNIYRVTATDGNGCIAKNKVEIIEPKKLEFEDIRIDSVSCPKYSDGVIDIYAKGGTITSQNQYQYSIDGGKNYYSSNKMTQLAAGQYQVVVKDINNCLALRNVTVSAPEELSVVANTRTNDTIKMGDLMNLYYTDSTLSGVLPVIQRSVWTPYETLSCSECISPNATPYSTTDYNLKVYYHKNCLATSQVRVHVYDPLDFFVPSAFSPGNGDGVNDILYLYGNGIKSIKFAVYNRWGEVVFESNHISRGWDGTYKGVLQESGVYTYVADVIYLNDIKRNKKGSITLIR